MGMYQTKPVRVEAVQYDGTEASRVAIANLHGVLCVSGSQVQVGTRAFIPIRLGWWVVSCAVGPIQVLDDVTFRRRYEPVDDGRDAQAETVDVLRRLTGGDEDAAEDEEAEPDA